MKIDLTWDLARLLNFTAKVATAIRMSSAEQHEDAAEDIMWLSDCLRKFGMLGHAVQEGNPGDIIDACDVLSKSYLAYQEISPNASRQAKPTYDRNAKRVNLNEAISIFQEIRARVTVCRGLEQRTHVPAAL